MNSLLSKAKKFPNTSGVYLFSDKRGKVLYVGRAVNLKRRIMQYFQVVPDLRIREMVKLSRDIKYFKTASLLEAVILEANLIKKYWPKYNIRERDDRSFIYIVISKNKDYPRPIIIRGKELKKFPSETAEIFGPYQSLSIVKNALRIIRRLFPYSVCKPHSGQPCFDYQIGLCPGVCIGAISKEDYQKNIENLILLLKGGRKKLIKILAKENPEKAKALKHIQDAALISKEEPKIFYGFNRIEGYDISHFAGKETYGSMVVFINGKKDSDEYRLFKIKKAPPLNDLEALKEMIERRFKHLEWPFPDLILIDGGKPQVDYISKALKNIKINIPLVGISKFKGDKLVFSVKTKKSLKELAENFKAALLKVRDEAHRFAQTASRRKRLIKNF